MTPVDTLYFLHYSSLNLLSSEKFSFLLTGLIIEKFRSKDTRSKIKGSVDELNTQYSLNYLRTYLEQNANCH